MGSVIVVALTSLASFLACLLALRQILSGIRRRWLEDEAHSRALLENTAAVREMTSQMTALTIRLDDHERRLNAGGL